MALMAGETVSGDPTAFRNYSTASAAFVSSVLKSQFGNSEDFLVFERNFYYQIEELSTLRSTCEQLRTAVSKLQEEKRAVELQLVSEKVSRDQEVKNARMEIEKNNVQQNAQMYAIKCETESWKRKAEAITTECAWLKEQMKSVEIEKNQAVQKLCELKSSLNEFERCRQSFDSYSRRQRELMQLASKKLEELEKAKDGLSKITESNQKQLDMMSSQLRNWREERNKSSRRIAELENELMTTKAELAQNSAKLARIQMAETETSDLVEKLLEENKDLRNGIEVLTKTVGDQINIVDQQLIERANKLHQQIDASVKRLSLKESDF